MAAPAFKHLYMLFTGSAGCAKGMSRSGHFPCMGRLVLLIFVVGMAGGATAAANRADDFAAVRSVIAEFNVATGTNDSERMLALFTKHGDYRVSASPPEKGSEAIRRLPPKRLPWDERMALTMEVMQIRFLRPDLAVADAVQSDYAPMTQISRRWSCTFILVHAGENWRIACYRESPVSDVWANLKRLPRR